MKLLQEFKAKFKKAEQTSFRVGDKVRVHNQIKEGDKTRIQVFEGYVIRFKNRTQQDATFTVRKIASGVGVERTYPLHSPLIEKVELSAPGRVRRARLYYLRDLSGKKARVRERQT